MVAASIWSSLIASAACVSAFVVPDELSGVGAPLLCGTKTSTPSRVVRRSEAKKAFIPRQATNSSTLLPIDVYMQIISSDGTPEGGDISDERIDAQMKILNEAFVPVGFQFNLVETIRTINEEWFSNLQVETPYETEVPQALKKGGNATLNVYTIGNTQAFAAAWSSLPYELQYQPIFDGIYMNHTMMIGGGNINGGNATFNRGKTLVHEAGHWFGLYHIFGYTCDMSYDYVADTPTELHPQPSGTCEVGKDSCPDQPGLDLIHNYMSYSNDDCVDSWTPGQIQRMREQVAKFRGVVYPGIDVGSIGDDDAASTQYPGNSTTDS